MALIYNASFDSTTRVLSLLDKAGNVISSCEVPRKSKELTLTATADNSSVKLMKNGTLSNTYEVNTGSGWQSYTFGTVIPLNAGERCKWRCSAHPTTQSNSNYVKFVMTGQIEASGNCNSMLNSDFENITSLTGYDYAFYNLFNGCTALMQAPELPATTLAISCYHNMFAYCSSLTQAPELPATTLTSDCYNSLFFGCSSLTQAPELPALTLDTRCYCYMFVDCTALTQAPELPATTLMTACYSTMFRGCVSFTKAPELPAETLQISCYASMFSGCSALTEVRIKATTTASYALKDWLNQVAASGTVYADPNFTDLPTNSASGIPTGWNRVPAVDDITKPLTFKATQDGSTVRLLKGYGLPAGSFQTSRDGGNTWVDYTENTTMTLNTGDEVSFRAKADRSAQISGNYFKFSMTGKIEAWHNVMSLYRTNDFATYNTVESFAFYYLFDGCTSLTKAPALPATTLNTSCYEKMFQGCTSLEEAPAIPATTLTQDCYFCMFKDCTSLTKAPVLPATTLADRCYRFMFKGCSNLNEVRCHMPSSYSSPQISSYADSWLSGVSSTGSFYTNADANWASGASGIPQNWTRLNIDDYPQT